MGFGTSNQPDRIAENVQRAFTLLDDDNAGDAYQPPQTSQSFGVPMGMRGAGAHSSYTGQSSEFGDSEPGESASQLGAR
jgi:hypothetical protein